MKGAGLSGTVGTQGFSLEPLVFDSESLGAVSCTRFLSSRISFAARGFEFACPDILNLEVAEMLVVSC